MPTSPIQRCCDYQIDDGASPGKVLVIEFDSQIPEPDCGRNPCPIVAAVEAGGIERGRTAGNLVAASVEYLGSAWKTEDRRLGQ
jgi:hypothetical protein